MRTLIYSCLLPVFLVVACKKHLPGDASLTGTWKMISYTNGFIGQTHTVPDDSLCLLSFPGDQKYQRSAANFIEKGSYYVINEQSIFTGKPAPLLLFDNAYAFPSALLYQIRKDTLDLAMNAADAYSYRYVRTP